MTRPNQPEITVQELSQMQAAGEAPFLLDVRRQHEVEIATLGGTLIPLHELPYRLDELEPYRDEPIVVYCRSGARSGQAADFLRGQGFTNVSNLKGGLLAWSREIDPSMPTY